MMKTRFIPLLTLLVLCFTAATAEAQIAKIRDGDAVNLTIRGVPDSESVMINGVYKVDQNGLLVGLPYLDSGSIRASGLTEGQLANKIAAAYRSAEIYTKATITALVDAPQIKRKITVAGRVGKKGQQEYYDGITIYDAVAAAGGADRFGQLKRVFLLRAGKKITFNLTKDSDKPFRLLPGDTIEVDQKKAWEP